MNDAGTGPISPDDLLALWRSVTDRGYSEPFIEQGEGRGLEAHTQAFAQHARVSEAIDRTTQSLYLLPYSGQTADPARTGAQAEVTLLLTRAQRFELGIILDRGVLIEEVATDASPIGPVRVPTGRRYALADRCVFSPGEAGPLEVLARAVAPGFGFNNPLPGTITQMVQPGAGLANARANIVPDTQIHRLVLLAQPDVIDPSQIGQYVQITGGANAGQVRWIVGYEDPLLDPEPTGGTIQLGAIAVYRLLTATGALREGEMIIQDATGASALVVAQTSTHLFATRVTGTLSPGLLAYGLQSMQAVVVQLLETGPEMTAETLSAQWRVLDWASDLGISATNPASPSGGRTAMLEELAQERGVQTAIGESEDVLRHRTTEAADTVSPNALLRAANRVLAPYGEEGCLREVGQDKFRGLFFDGDDTNPDPSVAFAFDLDFEVRPQDAWKVLVNYTEFRAFFVMGLPPITVGDFGCAFDAGKSNAFDCSPYLAFFDGYGLVSSAVYSQIWQELYRTRAGGVGFDLYLEVYGCV